MEGFLKKRGIHYAWVVLAASMIFNGLIAGAVYNVRGLFYTAICAAEGWDFTAFSISTVIMGLCGTFVMGPVARLYKRFPIKWVIFFSALAFGLAFMARAFMNSIFAFCVLSVFMGLAGGFLLVVPLPLVINNWFYSSRGLALGLSALSSGIGGAIASPIIAATIESMGWRRAALINGSTILLIALPVILLFIRSTPEELALKPYGADRIYDDPALSPEMEKSGKEACFKHIGEKDKKRCAVACIIFAALSQLLVGHSAQLAQHALSLGFSTAIGAMATSFCSIGNMTGKAVGGICIDRFGIRNTLSVYFMIVITGMLIMTLSGSFLSAFIIGSFLIGSMTFNTTVSPSVLLSTFSIGSDYMSYYFMVSRVLMLMSAFSNIIPSLLEKAFGGYAGVCILYAACAVIMLLLSFYILRRRK